MLTAARAVTDDSAPIRATAKMHGVHYSTLCGYVKRVKSAWEAELPILTTGYKSNRRVFTDEQEKALAAYMITASDLYYGMSPKEERVLAYQCAVKFGVKHPGQWDKAHRAGRAGEDWLSRFLARNPVINQSTRGYKLGQSD